jgi:alkanesulfonate monooxygenase SsuD/methylene tetrahydromethanopterin reductase-like flavin-dependent oxidoreductase (luciferase family)
MEALEEFGRQTQEKYSFEVQEGKVICGSQRTVAQKLNEIQRLYQVDEIFIVTAIRDFQSRLHSYRLLSEVSSQVPA